MNKLIPITRIALAAILSGIVVAVMTHCFIHADAAGECKHIYDNNLELKGAIIERDQYIIILENEIVRLNELKDSISVE